MLSFGVALQRISFLLRIPQMCFRLRLDGLGAMASICQYRLCASSSFALYGVRLSLGISQYLIPVGFSFSLYGCGFVFGTVHDDLGVMFGVSL